MADQLKNLINELDSSSWEGWKQSLAQLSDQAREAGISNDLMENFATQFGDYLTHNVNPDVPENKALKELWQAADKDEQHVLAHLMLKLTN